MHCIVPMGGSQGMVSAPPWAEPTVQSIVPFVLVRHLAIIIENEAGILPLGKTTQRICM